VPGEEETEAELLAHQKKKRLGTEVVNQGGRGDARSKESEGALKLEGRWYFFSANQRVRLNREKKMGGCWGN